MININFVGSRINKLRKLSNLTMKEFAELTGCSAGYISDIEHSKNIPSISKLIEICKALNITLSDFFDEGSDPVVLIPELKELINNAKELTPEQLEKLNEFIKTIK